jgi:hypothetical protein
VFAVFKAAPLGEQKVSLERIFYFFQCQEGIRVARKTFIACFLVARLRQISVRHGTKKRKMTSPSLVAADPSSCLGAGQGAGHWFVSQS